jgi:hypothetical protein
LHRPVLLFGPENDPHLQGLCAHLHAGGQAVRLVGTRKGKIGVGVFLDDQGQGTLFVDDKMVDPAAIFVRTLPPRHGPDLLFDLQARFASESVLVDAAMARGRRAQVRAFVQVAHARGVPMINPPVPAFFQPDKVLDLMAAGEAGLFPVPTRLTPFGRLGEPWGRILAKSPAGGAPARFFAPQAHSEGSEGRNEGGPQADPMLLQPFVEGSLLRTLILDGKIIATGMLRQWKGPDHRQDPRFVAGALSYEEGQLDVDQAAALLAFVRRRKLRFCSCEFLRPDAGGPDRFVECNPSPAWLELEEALQVPITGMVAEALLSPGAS